MKTSKFYLSSYACANLALSFINKSVVRQKEVKIGFLLLAQCLITVAAVQFLVNAKKKLGHVINVRRVCEVFPASLLYAVQHYTRMQSMSCVSIDAILVGRQLVPLLCAMLEKTFLIEKKRQTRNTIMSMTCIVVGVCVYTYGKTTNQHIMSWPLSMAYLSLDIPSLR